jgi:hypothetical protein
MIFVDTREHMALETRLRREAKRKGLHLRQPAGDDASGAT